MSEDNNPIIPTDQEQENQENEDTQFHKYPPDYYKGKLSAESSRHRADVEDKLAELYAASTEASGIARLTILSEIEVYEQQLSWQGANPKGIPIDELREHIQAPHSDDPVENKYRRRIRNRATAIRAFCVWCMGGDLVGVRECSSITCPLHPFRMGKDPLRGYAIPRPVAYVPEDEDAADFEEGDEGVDKDA